MNINIKVTPKAKENSIKKIDSTNYHIKITAPPDKGKANQAIIKLLAKELKIPKSSLQIIKGKTSRNKIIEIS